MSLKELSTRLLSESPFIVNVFTILIPSSSGKVWWIWKGFRERTGSTGTLQHVEEMNRNLQSSERQGGRLQTVHCFILQKNSGVSKQT